MYFDFSELLRRTSVPVGMYICYFQIFHFSSFSDMLCLQYIAWHMLPIKTCVH